MLLVQSKTAKKNCVTEIIEIIVDNNGTAFANSAKSQKLNFSPGQLWMAMAENGPKPKNWNEIDASLPNAKIKILAPPQPLEPVMLETPSSWIQGARKPEWFLVRSVMASEKMALLGRLVRMAHRVLIDYPLIQKPLAYLVSASLTKIETRFKAPQSMISKSASTLFRATNIRSLVHSFLRKKSSHWCDSRNAESHGRICE